MSWVAVGVAAVGAVKGGMDAKAANKRAKSNDAFRKATIQNSPWTGMGDPGAPNVGNTDMMSGALGGGLQGYAMGSGFAGGGASAAPSGGSMGANGMSGGAQISAMNYAQPQATPQFGSQSYNMKPANPWAVA